MSDEPPWSSSRAPIIAVVAAVAVLLIVPLVSRRDATVAAAAVDDGPTLSVLVRDASGVRTLSSGDVVRPGDTLHFSVRTPDGAQVTVVGVDAAGRARVHAGPLHVDAGERPLPGEVVLDAALGDERYVAFACVFPVGAEALVTAARAARPGVDGCSFDVVTARKRAR